MRQQTHQNKPLNTLVGVCDCGKLWHPDKYGVKCPSCGRGVLVPAGRTSQEIGDRLHEAWGFKQADEEDADHQPDNEQRAASPAQPEAGGGKP